MLIAFTKIFVGIISFKTFHFIALIKVIYRSGTKNSSCHSPDAVCIKQTKLIVWHSLEIKDNSCSGELFLSQYTKLLVFWKWTNTEYRIVLLGLNYSNTQYLTSNSTPKKFFICEFCEKWDEDTLILYFHTYMRAFYCVFYTYLAYKKF